MIDEDRGIPVCIGFRTDVLCTCWNGDLIQCPAVLEGMVADSADGVRQYNVLQGSTSFKGRDADAPKSVGVQNRFQICLVQS